ncbi:MAG: hypothetical protein EBU33_04785, partial [Sphingobacteriia bacterium]|nr:hypothetical protein [Sphingobacteriia bacterium]
GYCGPAKFLKEGLVEEAIEFFHDSSLTVQGSDLLRDMRKSMELHPRRNILILRLSYGELGGKLSRKENKAFYKFLKNLDYFPESLAKLKNLRWMDLRNILIPAQNQENIQSMLPECKIYFSPPCNCSW